MKNLILPLQFGRTVGRICAALTLLVCLPSTGRAQSAVDGFDPNANSNLYAMAVQADGRILVAGVFTSIGGQTRNRIARLNADGSVDTTFDPNANGDVDAVAVQTDGKILVVGIFTSIGGQHNQ
jgi:uncharacterized delta-60 repeat protein